MLSFFRESSSDGSSSDSSSDDDETKSHAGGGNESNARFRYKFLLFVEIAITSNFFVRQSMSELGRKQNHPARLHRELWFNESNQVGIKGCKPIVVWEALIF